MTGNPKTSMRKPSTNSRRGSPAYQADAQRQSEDIGGAVETPDGRAISARVTAIPEAGRANEALRKLIAKTLRVAKSNVELIAGIKSRVKTFAVSGDPVALARILREL